MKIPSPNHRAIPHPHPGETLWEDFMEPKGLTSYRVARELGVSPTAVGEILSGRRSISPEMALRLEAYTGASAQFWINLQSSYDLEKARHSKSMTAKLAKILTPFVRESSQSSPSKKTARSA